MAGFMFISKGILAFFATKNSVMSDEERNERAALAAQTHQDVISACRVPVLVYRHAHARCRVVYRKTSPADGPPEL